MRILHTSDWHLGKRLEGRDRLPEQRDALREIAEIAGRENADLALVAGDVYDVYTPSAEAEDAFFEGVERLARVCPVAVIGGNHDDAKRLAAARPLAEKKEIYLAGTNRVRFAPPARPSFACRLERSGDGYLLFRKGEERVWLGVLPYPNEARFKEEEREGSDAEKIRGWMADCFRENTEGVPQVLVSHLFAAGSRAEAGERDIELGGARAVPAEYFPDCAYIALGHIHKYQKLSESRHIWYSGAVLPYAFDEANAEKCVQVFDLVGARAESVRKIPLTSGRKLVRLEANSPEAAEVLLSRYQNIYAELNLFLEHPLAPAEYREFTARHPEVVKLVLSFPGAARAAASVSRRSLPDGELFCDYYRSLYGEDAPEELLSLFLRLMGGVHETR